MDTSPSAGRDQTSSVAAPRSSSVASAGSVRAGSDGSAQASPTAQSSVDLRSLADRFDEVSGLLAELNGTDLLALGSREVLDAVGRVETLRRQIDALGAKVIAAAQADGMWATTGARTFTAWYRNATGRHRTTAAQQVRQSQLLRDVLPLAARALESGEISLDHVAALTRHVVDTPERLAQLRDPSMGEAFLVERAKVMDAADFLSLVKHWAIRTDPDAADRAWKAESERQELVVAETMGGYHVQGWLTTVNGQMLLAALDARTGTPSAGDARSTAQRRADSLVSLAHLSVDSGVLRPGARIRPHLSVTVPLDTLRRLIDAAAPSGGHMSCDADMTGPTTHPQVIPGRLDYSHLRGAEAATLAGGEPIPHQQLARLACQGAFHRVLFGADSEILDVGREERLFTAAQTRAIIARDRRCQFPGCDAPPGEGEIHHSIWWYEHYGKTSVGLGLLLCWYHHEHVHQREISIERVGDAWRFTRPGGSEILAGTGPSRSWSAVDGSETPPPRGISASRQPVGATRFD